MACVINVMIPKGLARKKGIVIYALKHRANIRLLYTDLPYFSAV